nr:hypothetical protein Iba_chr02dCG0020 [Ipomoea batatas]
MHERSTAAESPQPPPAQEEAAVHHLPPHRAHSPWVVGMNPYPHPDLPRVQSGEQEEGMTAAPPPLHPQPPVENPFYENVMFAMNSTKALPMKHSHVRYSPAHMNAQQAVTRSAATTSPPSSTATGSRGGGGASPSITFSMGGTGGGESLSSAISSSRSSTGVGWGTGRGEDGGATPSASCWEEEAAAVSFPDAIR